MPTKAQAKAAIDAAATSAKADIDSLPAIGGGIKDGSMSFGPSHFNIVLDAGGSLVTADSWRDSIKTFLAAQAREFTEDYLIGRRRNEGPGDKVIRIESTATSFIIINF